MASLTESKLPVINIENLEPGTESWILACHKVRHTLEEYGCFMVVCKEFTQDLKEEVYANLKTLFDLPEETKLKNNSKPLHGYVGSSPDRPLFESMGIDIDDATSLDDVESFTNLMWPSGNQQFSKTIHSYANLVTKLENLVRKMVFESYGIEKYHESFSESLTYLFKPIKYKQPAPNETNLGIREHTDKSFISILTQNQMNGLEVQIKDDEWIGVEYLPSSILVMASDAFMAWSNGRIKSARHRVFINGQEQRYSIVFTSASKGIIEIPDELVDEEHPPRFHAFDHSKFIESFAKDPRYTYEDAIVSYCGY